MATRNILKSYFETGDTPTAAQFAALIDSVFNLNDDAISIATVTGLQNALNGKATLAQVQALIGDITALTSIPSGSRDNIVDVLLYMIANPSGGAETNPTAFTVTSTKSEIPPGTVIGIGANLWPTIKAMLAPYTHAAYTAPTAGLSGVTAPNNFEVGQTVNIAFTTVFNQNDAGAETTMDVAKDGTLLVSVGGVYSDSIVVALAAINYQAIAHYAQGAIKNDSNGNPDATGRIAAGSVASNTLTYQGYRAMFYGAAATEAATSADARALNKQLTNAGNQIVLQTGTTYNLFEVIIPNTLSITAVLDNTTHVDITSDYVLVDGAFSVNDAAGVATTNKKYVKLNTAGPYLANHVHIITIG